MKDAQSKWRFTSHAKKDPETGEMYLGTDEFISIIAPPSEDYVSRLCLFLGRRARVVSLTTPSAG